MPDNEPNRRLTLKELIAAAPDILSGITSGLVQIAGADPLTAELAANSIAIALRIDRAHRETAVARAAYTTQLTADAVGRSLDDLEQLVQQTTAQTSLTARILAAAARTPLEQKLPALARVLANGLDGSTTVDVAFLLAAALDDIEAPHIHVLTAIRDEKPPPDEVSALSDGWADWMLANRFPGYRAVLPVLTNTLSRHGLIVDSAVGTFGGLEAQHRYVATDTAAELLDLIGTVVEE
jgi:hypothetical protein